MPYIGHSVTFPSHFFTYCAILDPPHANLDALLVTLRKRQAHATQRNDVQSSAAVAAAVAVTAAVAAAAAGAEAAADAGAAAGAAAAATDT